MDNYKPNSHRSRTEQETPEVRKKVEKVVKGNVKSTKKTGIRKLTENFISEDVNNVKSYVLMDVLLPAAKKAIYDIVTDGIDMILYGEVRGNKKQSGSSNKISYTKYYDRRDRDDDRYSASRRSRTIYDLDDIIIESRGEAEEVLSRMDELLETYGMVTVADLYDLVGISCNYTDNNYGWTNIRNAEVVRVRDGYRIKLPKVLPIK